MYEMELLLSSIYPFKGLGLAVPCNIFFQWEIERFPKLRDKVLSIQLDAVPCLTTQVHLSQTRHEVLQICHAYSSELVANQRVSLAWKGYCTDCCSRAVAEVAYAVTIDLALDPLDVHLLSHRGEDIVPLSLKEHVFPHDVL